jgi:hypothetical protein
MERIQGVKFGTNQRIWGHISFRAPNGNGWFFLALALMSIRIEIIEPALYMTEHPPAYYKKEARLI